MNTEFYVIDDPSGFSSGRREPARREARGNDIKQKNVQKNTEVQYQKPTQPLPPSQTKTRLLKVASLLWSNCG
eukprot:gene13052-3820_t